MAKSVMPNFEQNHNVTKKYYFFQSVKVWLYVWTRVVQHKELTVSTLYSIISLRYFDVY